MADLVNISLSSQTHEIANSLLDVFDTLIDVARFAFAYAIREDLISEYGTLQPSDGKRSVWNVGSLDPDGYMSNLVLALDGSIQEPFKQIELLINLGLMKIGQSRTHGGPFNVSDWL